jgi:hypothetical protein
VPAASSMAQGKAPASRMAAIRSQRASEVIPNRAWATASVMSSAPDSRQAVVDLHVQCGDEGCPDRSAQPDLGHPNRLPAAGLRHKSSRGRGGHVQPRCGSVMTDISAISMARAARSHRRQPRRTATVIVLVVVLTAMALATSMIFLHTSRDIAAISGGRSGRVMPGSAQFSYGFDFAQQGPYSGAQFDASSVVSAHRVMSSIPGMYEDTSIMDWGLPDPEPSPGRFDFSAIAERIRLITSTGGTPVVTLCAAPDWMKNGTSSDSAPTPVHYRDFALLAAKIAQSFPQVKYFVVWNELKGFWNKAANDWNIQGYTAMYNDVYVAIKRVRPDALVGGPYAPTPPYATPKAGTLPSTPHGAWGYLDPRTMNAIRYWLANRAGADFMAVDGPDFPETGQITDPLTATEKYVAADRWLREQASLPIWWIESSIQPANSGWSERQAAAIRIAALVQLASSGARVGMQWQPQQGGGSVSDEGLWTGTDRPGGGRPTVLAQILPTVLTVLRYPVTIVASHQSQVLVASGGGGTIAINTSAASATATINGTSVSLGPGQVRITYPGHS